MYIRLGVYDFSDDGDNMQDGQASIWGTLYIANNGASQSIYLGMQLNFAAPIGKQDTVADVSIDKLSQAIGDYIEEELQPYWQNNIDDLSEYSDDDPLVVFSTLDMSVVNNLLIKMEEDYLNIDKELRR